MVFKDEEYGTWLSITLYIWVSARKTLTPLLTHWSYVFLVLTHRMWLGVSLTFRVRVPINFSCEHIGCVSKPVLAFIWWGCMGRETFEDFWQATDPGVHVARALFLFLLLIHWYQRQYGCQSSWLFTGFCFKRGQKFKYLCQVLVSCMGMFDKLIDRLINWLINWLSLTSLWTHKGHMRQTPTKLACHSRNF